MTAISLAQLNNSAVSSMQRASYLQAAKTLHKAVLHSFHKNEEKSHKIINHKRSRTGEMKNEGKLSQHDQNKYENHSPVEESSQQRQRKRRRCCCRCPSCGDLSSIMDGRLHVRHCIRSLPVNLGAEGAIIADSLAHSIFNHALKIENDEQSNDLSLSVQQSQVKAVLIYNLALSHHVQGIRTNSSKEISLALEAYELSFCILEEVKNSIPMEAIILQLLALFNNMASIHAMQYNLDALTRCIAWMEKAICSFESEVLEKREFQFFFKNVMLLTTQNSISLAAAA